jgi:hypothetical protein
VSAAYYGVTGAAEHSFGLYTRRDAVVLCDQLMAGLERLSVGKGSAGVTVVGGGATGVELAGTLAELIRCEIPAILVPYPHAASDHQRANAAFFERQGGGLVVDEAAVGDLHTEVLDLIFNDWLLRQFRGNLRRMDRANSLELMLADLEDLARPATGVGSAPPAEAAA